MAITAAMTVASATAKAGQRVACTCTVTNSGVGAVNVTAIQPVVTINGQTEQDVAAAAGVPGLGPGATVTVAGGGGTLAKTWDVVAHAPTTSYGFATPASLVYSVGATVYTSDGSIAAATPATITVTNPSGL